MRITKTMTHLVVGTIFCSASLHAEAQQESPDSRTTLQALSKSIVSEALSERPSSQPSGAATTPAQPFSGAGAGSRQGLSQLAANLPSVPVAFADGAVKTTLAPGATELRYKGDNATASVNLGFGYIKEQNALATGGGKADLAVLPFEALALGTNFSHYVNRNDVAVNAVWQIPNSGLRVKATGGYLWGNQNFDFASGSANVDLQQLGYVFSTQYIVPKADELSCLHSIGFSLWGARATQRSYAGGTTTFQTETATDYIISSDPHTLSAGRMFGASADTQIALFQNLVTRGSVGYEQVRFPFADGTSELNRSAFYNVDLRLELFSDVTVGAGYKKGAAENLFSLNLESGNWQLNAYRNDGQNGIADNKGVLLSYRLGIGGSTKHAPLARRMQPSRSNDGAALLAAATTRPAQLPQSFLAKVDLTAVTELLKISKAGLPSGATVNTEDDVFVTVGTGTPTVTDVTRNGSPIVYTALVGTTVDKVVIHGKQFPAATTSDTYLIHVTDGNGNPYTITVIVD
ncbi:MAG: hypothetical protein HGB04_08410 [Chlorobiaceae bacterium]|nr:hypothetical protein [Chlorobiaceae bacterium]